MNRSDIEWCDHTWNPITGCRHNCQYCYAKRMTARFAGDVRLNLMAKKDYFKVAAADGGKDLFVLDKPMINETGKALVYPFGFEPTYHQYRLNMLEKLKVGNRIFVGAMADLFGNWVPDEWISEVFSICREHPRHVYMFLTKNPDRYWELEDKKLLPVADNHWYGYSYTRSGDRCWGSKMNNKHSFVSVEPLLEDLSTGLFNFHCLPAAEWVIIGAETGRRKEKVVPEKEWIDKILLHCDKYKIPVFMKDSLIPIIGGENMRREYPKVMEEYLEDKKLTPKQKEKLYGNCSKCGAFERKNGMITLCARAKRGVQPKQIGFMCDKCFAQFCQELSTNPELER